MIHPRQTLRSLFSPPLVTLVAILSLALGIGANAAIFSIFATLVLEPLPVEQPDRLVNLRSDGPISGSMSSNTSGGSDEIFSYPMFRDLEEAASDPSVGFSSIVGHRGFSANLAYQGVSSSAEGFYVSGSYFGALGLRPALGRLLEADDDLVFGAHDIVVLSHRFWVDRFERDPTVLDQPLIVNGHPLTIVGVAPRGFEGTTVGMDASIFVPLTMRAELTPWFDDFEDRRNYWVYVFGRLADGATIDSASAALNVTFSSILEEVELPLQTNMSEEGLERFRMRALHLNPGGRGQSDLHEDVETPLLFLLGVTTLVLLIACANVANLLLAKASNRASEIAIRMSIGARRHQVVTQLLVESFLLAIMGAALGFLVAGWTVRGIASILPPGSGPTIEFRIGPATLIFMAVMVAVTGLVGLFPALHCTRNDLVAAMRNQSTNSTRSRGANRFRAVMATIQIALSMTLLIVAGLFTRSLVNVARIDLGIEKEHLATFGISPELNAFTPEQSRALFQRLEDEIAVLPGVRSVAGSQVPLISGNNWGNNVTVQGYPDGPDVDTHSNFNSVGPGFFSTLGIPLIAGREFDERDTLETPGVAIVNEAFARKFQLGQDAVGKRMAMGSTRDLDLEIVGLVKDAKYSEVKGEIPPVFYLPYRQREGLGSLYFYVRTGSDPKPMLATLRSVVQRLEPDLPVEDLRTMELQVQETIVLDRVLSILSAAFALLATLLAAVGLYGVLAYAVAQRRREIGLRMALGADSGRVRGMILRQVGWLTVPGALIGIAAALGLGKLASSMLFEMEAFDPSVFGIAVVLLGATAIAAAAFPARRATRVDPMVVLREE